MKKNIPLLALILPSKGRFLDLMLTLIFTSLKNTYFFKVQFFVVANYSNFQIFILKFMFSHRAIFIDERDLDCQGANTAYNYGFELAKNNGARWVALWADDLLPLKLNWLDELYNYLTKADFQFGIFSTDEGYHKGRYGWNIEAGYPCAHFYVACTDSLPGHLLNPALKNFLADNEIAISRIKQSISISLLPIKLIHQPTFNLTRLSRIHMLKDDLERLYEIHPELNCKLDNIILNGDVNDINFKFILDEGKLTKYELSTKVIDYSEFISKSKYFIPPIKIRLVYFLRRVWNRFMLIIDRLCK